MEPTYKRNDIKGLCKLGQIRKVKFLLDRNCLQKIYFSFIRPALEYAEIIWDNLPEYHSLKIENIQLEAARIVTEVIEWLPRDFYTEKLGVTFKV